MAEFVNGLQLCEGFFRECGQQILAKHFPALRYSAGLLGYGSDVLGYDDGVSTDHMWGPRFYLFLSEEDIHQKTEIMKVFEQEMPVTYKGYSVNFSPPDPNGGGIRCPAFLTAGKVSPLVWIHTPEEFRNEYLGKQPETGVDWLAISEHRLLAFTAGKLFVDMLNMQAMREGFSFYPRDVKLYLIASQWAVISEEQAFGKRCGVRGDEIGAQINCARIAERLMRLCFLYENRYAPYSKWFGTSFSALPVNPQIKTEIELALAARHVAAREQHLVSAQSLVAQLHNESRLTPPVSTIAQPYFGRDIQVIDTGKIAQAMQKEIADQTLQTLPLFGTLSQVGNFVALSDDVKHQSAIRALYERL